MSQIPQMSIYRARLLSATVVIVWFAVVANNLFADPAPLPPALRDLVRDARFQIVTSIRGLPLDVRGELQKLFGSGTLDIAEPRAPFQATDIIVDPTLPNRRLVAAGCTIEYCLVHYERGGFAHTWHVALFHWTPDATRFEWGGTAPGRLPTIDDVRKAILSGVVQGTPAFW